MSLERLEDLRHTMKTITHNIISLINERMVIAKEIGKIKNELKLNIVDDKIEQEVKNYILKESDRFGLDPQFSGRIVNLLIDESVNIQNVELKKKQNISNSITNTSNVSLNTNKNLHSRDPKALSDIKIKTHMDVFNKAKMLDSVGKKLFIWK
jgi:chorismate mutase